jgi:hypothetical protein
MFSDLPSILIPTSTVGFVLFFALADLVPLAWDFLKRVEEQAILPLLLDFRIRFISRLIGRAMISVFLIASLSSVLSCLFGILYIIFSYDLFLSLSLYLELSAILVVAAATFSATVSAVVVFPGELRKILEYYERKP